MSPQQDVAEKLLASQEVESITLEGNTVTTKRFSRLAVDIEADRIRKAEHDAIALERAARTC